MKGRLVTLRWPSDDDYPAIARWVRPLSGTAVLTGDSEPVSADDVRQLNKRGQVNHLMIDTNDGRTIGVVSWHAVGSPGGYSIGGAVGDPDLWQKGFGAEAMSLLVDYLFHVRNAHRVQVTTALFNRHSVQVLARGDFVLEGILRDYYFLDGAYHDAAVWSLLRDEYYRSVAEVKAINEEWGVQDLVPAADKAAARAALATYLAKGRPTSLGAYAEASSRTRPDRPIGSD